MLDHRTFFLFLFLFIPKVITVGCQFGEPTELRHGLIELWRGYSCFFYLCTKYLKIQTLLVTQCESKNKKPIIYLWTLNMLWTEQYVWWKVLVGVLYFIRKSNLLFFFLVDNQIYSPVMLTCAIMEHVKDFINSKYLLQNINF